MKMKTTSVLIFATLLATPLFAEGFRSLDLAVSSVTRGFERGESHPIVGGVGDQVMLDFPGLLGKSGFFGRDQASYLLDELFSKARPVSFEVNGMRKVSAQSQYHIEADWTVTIEGEEQTRSVFITLQNRDDRWFVASVKSSSDR